MYQVNFQVMNPYHGNFQGRETSNLWKLPSRETSMLYKFPQELLSFGSPLSKLVESKSQAANQAVLSPGYVKLRHAHMTWIWPTNPSRLAAS